MDVILSCFPSVRRFTPIEIIVQNCCTQKSGKNSDKDLHACSALHMFRNASLVDVKFYFTVAQYLLHVLVKPHVEHLKKSAFCTCILSLAFKIFFQFFLN